MNRKQFFKKFGTQGTKRIRKQISLAISRGKTVVFPTDGPNFNPFRERRTKFERYLLRNQRSAERILSTIY